MMSTASDSGSGLRAWRAGAAKSIVLDQPRILAILNVTPDSFSDGGTYATPEAVAEAAALALRDGADGLDVGGESTRPGARRVPAAEQIRRIVPAIRAIRSAVGPAPPMSVDTTLAEVAAAALDTGADAINDVSAGTEDARMLDLAARRGAGVILMHRLAPPQQDSYSDRYATPPDYSAGGGVVAVVRQFLADRAAAALAAGIAPEGIVLDPGLGFGKTVDQNLELIARTGELAALGYPILSGASRKSFVGRVSGLGAESSPLQRVHGSVALSVVHWSRGASIFRVHDVPAHAQALRAASAAARACRAGGAVDGDVGACG